MNETETKEPGAPPEEANETGAGMAPLPDDDASTVWLVSYSDNDDRELRPPEIAEALRLGEITAETIVWRQGATDWLPISQVPALAKLMPSTGETATAPMVVQNAAMLRRAARPDAPATDANPTGAEIQPPAAGAKPPTAGAKPSIAGRPVPTAKGTTKLGLPRVDPKTLKKTDAAPLPKAPPAPKAADVRKPAPAAPPAPRAVKPASPAAPPAQSTTPTSARAKSSKDIWGSSPDDEEAPISIEPESLRPPSPAPARAIQRAKALSAGTLGIKKPPAPPRPPEKLAEKQPPPAAAAPAPPAPKAPAPVAEPEPNEATPSLGTLAAPATLLAEAKRILERDAATAKPPIVAAPSIDVGDVKVEAPLQSPFAVDTEASIPIDTSASIAALTAPADEPAETHAAEARPSQAARPAKKNVRPLVAAVAAVVLLAFLLMHGKKPAEGPQADVEPQSTAAKTAEPEPARPAEPAAAAPENAPAMTAQAAPEAPTPAEPENAAPEKTPTTGVAKNGPASSKEKPATDKTPSSKTADTKPADTKPAETKATPAPAPAQKEVAVGGEFDKAAAAAALGAAAQEASGCRKEGDPSGVAVVHLTFSNAGRATRAVIEGPPFAGTATGGCIASTLRKATVPPYGGDRVTVTKRVIIH